MNIEEETAISESVSEIIRIEIETYLDLKRSIKEEQNLLKQTREIIISIMKDNGMLGIKTESGSASLSFPKSFDQNEMRINNKKEYFEFTTVIQIRYDEEEFDKKGFKKKYPELYTKYEIESTPRLTVK